VIGEGSYGKVYKTKNKKGELLACKIISKAKLENLSINDIISKNFIVKIMRRSFKKDLKHRVRY
jgi:hypothetical protein